ncbi:hypothetical protein K493DRAFT_299375 [Basidiobolus meristosporus CBS 931.73]|uniref:Uncharacterized protein n=1 Tax=Basidiobolus meristosporus CBS 931.73 TaxID=1314790 RepID=A0A1Y1YN75_9FUNG|nr:hypothetical protein K493DRAFT_299375 [Basidiobolus meristosporus CBS 931.73]|eukprot:ORX99461.1 hypothetical protein K493DRAFT_299375 [Basidiobolus meristosporus CBS 931.73]
MDSHAKFKLLVKRTTECTKKCGSNVNCHIGCIRDYFQKGSTGGAYTNEHGGKDHSNKDTKKPANEKESKHSSSTETKPTKSGHEQPRPEKETKMSTEVPKSSVSNHNTSVIAVASPTKTVDVTSTSLTTITTSSSSVPFSVPSVGFPFATAFPSSRLPFSSYSSSRPIKTGTRSASVGNLNLIPIIPSFLIPWICYREFTA